MTRGKKRPPKCRRTNQKLSKWYSWLLNQYAARSAAYELAQELIYGEQWGKVAMATYTTEIEQAIGSRTSDNPLDFEKMREYALAAKLSEPFTFVPSRGTPQSVIDLARASGFIVHEAPKVSP